MSSFQGLPREIMQKCVEFLPFDFVTAALKSVSKATRGAARRALTRGRWRPIRYAAEQGLAVCAVEDEHCILSFAAFATPGPSAAASATFRAAWAIDPGLVFRVISEWDVRSLVVYPRRWQDIRPSADSGVYQVRFLLIVERSMDGLSRIVPRGKTRISSISCQVVSNGLSSRIRCYAHGRDIRQRVRASSNQGR